MTRMSVVLAVALASCAAIFPRAAVGQQGFTTAFPPEEFTARRAKVMRAIGDGVAILQGTTERAGRCT